MTRQKNDTNAASSGETIVMGTLLEAWIRVLGTSRICRYHAHEVAIKRSCLSAIIGGALIWIKASERCLAVASV